MKYRKLEKLNKEVSLLGFGCMRFPTTEDGHIDEARAMVMMDEAIASGVNYIDTAYPYHDGESEIFVGKVLKKYPRESLFLATKMPFFSMMQTKEDPERLFNEQLQKLDVEYFDFYLLHCLNKDFWHNKVLGLGALDFCIEMQKQGKIKHLGFSFHDDYEVFEEILNYRDWDFCQIQYNYMDTNIQAGDKGYELAASKGVPVIVMEPIKGGALSNLPEDISKIFKEYDAEATNSRWALRWVATHPNVKVILSGMSSEEHVKDNLETFNLDRVELNEEELQVVANVRNAIEQRVKNGCTGCSYCMPCPFGVDIPRNFALWNQASMYGNYEKSKQRYATLKEAQACYCKECGKCEKVCPQAIQIRENLKQVHEELGK